MSAETKRETGGPAFPTDHSRDDSYTLIKGGMTLRDYFAAKAMVSAIEHQLLLRSTQIAPGEFRCDAVARAAYEMADAMLAEREK